MGIGVGVLFVVGGAVGFATVADGLGALTMMFIGVFFVVASYLWARR